MTEAEHPPLLSSVVVLRLRDYARRPVPEQARLSAQLDAVLAVLLPDLAVRERIVLAGHGSAAVAVLGNPPAALNFGGRALRANQAGLGLSVGIDHGPVEIVGTESGDALAGDGLATAALMAAVASDAGLMASERFRTALAQAAPGAQSALVSAGSVSDAGLRTFQAYGLDPDAPRRRRRRFILIGLAATGLLLAAAFALRLGAPDRPRPLAPYIDSATAPVAQRLRGLIHGQP